MRPDIPLPIVMLTAAVVMCRTERRMAHFHGSPEGEDDLVGRFDRAEGARGIVAWRTLVGTIGEFGASGETEAAHDQLYEAFDRFLGSVLKEETGAPPPACVFVSHSHKDADFAVQIAGDAWKVGFDYWLDVHDPLLGWANAATAPVKAVLIAAIIEIALLNSTHIVSVQTTNSRPSRWVPYEFERAKRRSVRSLQAGSWFQTKPSNLAVAPDPLGDYLALGICAMTEASLVGWLSKHATSLLLPARKWLASLPHRPVPN